MTSTVVQNTDFIAADEVASGFREALVNDFPKREFYRTAINYSFTRAPERIMPVTAGSPTLLASFPSFMSVFGGGNILEERQRQQKAGGDTGVMNSPNRAANVAKRPSPSSHFSPSMLRRDSVSTFESTDSSPTTTISTVDSSLTEPSPSSSPESPSSLLLHSSTKPFAINSKAARNMPDQKDQYSNSLTTLPGLNRADSPNKKMRNTKNLFVNTSASFRQGNLLPKLAVSTVPAHVTHRGGYPFSEPTTPSFIVPPKPTRRRPSNLGLTLSTADPGSINQAIQEGSSEIPDVPSSPNIRTLRYSHLTSNFPIFSPTLAPEGGMRLPPFGNQSGASRLGKSGPPLNTQQQTHTDYPSSSPTTVQTLDHVQEESEYELPLSREAKSPAYPQGPVCIYEPSVYLYLEPSDTEASEFDVILNVAREVKNPFSVVTEKATLPRVEDALQVSMGPGSTFFAGRDSISEPQTAISDESFSSALENMQENANRRNSSAAAAPKATPEYIHIPWDHNTNVVDDLLRLCELIDDRVRQEKKVLIHCQCGVSRSASLVVAYGLYKNPDLTVQEAYNAVKSRSRWIGPNMSLIYQLSEFKSNIQRKSSSVWRKQTSGWATKDAIATAKLQTGLEGSMLRIDSQQGASKGPATAPCQEDRSPQHGRAKSIGPPNLSHNIATSTVSGDITPGPSSAPPDMIWSPGTVDANPVEANAMDETLDSTLPPLGKVMDIDSSSWPSLPDEPPARSVCETASLLPPPEPTYAPPPPPTSFAIPQPHPAGFSSLAARRRVQRRIPLRQEPRLFAAINYATFDNVPETPSLLSPRAAEFTASPFHRTVAGDLAGSSIFEQGLLSPKDDDPRSPAQRGEAPITRNIFGVF